MGRPRKSALRDTRRDILDHSLDLFAESGFFGTSMREIARAVGIRESAIYHHFPSKDAILHALLQELGPGRANIFRQMDVVGMVKAVGGREFLRQVTDMIMVSWTTPQEQKIFRLILSEGLRLGAEGVLHPAVLIERARMTVADLFRQLSAAGLIRPVDPMAAALGLMGPMAILRANYLAMSTQPTDLKKLRGLLEHQMDFFWDAIKPEKATAKRAR